jgi:hypothetical protein
MYSGALNLSSDKGIIPETLCFEKRNLVFCIEKEKNDDYYRKTKSSDNEKYDRRMTSSSSYFRSDEDKKRRRDGSNFEEYEKNISTSDKPTLSKGQDSSFTTVWKERPEPIHEPIVGPMPVEFTSRNDKGRRYFIFIFIFIFFTII